MKTTVKEKPENYYQLTLIGPSGVYKTPQNMRCVMSAKGGEPARYGAEVKTKINPTLFYLPMSSDAALFSLEFVPEPEN